MLRRLLRYGDKVVQLSALLAGIRDTRLAPQIPTGVIVRGALVMALARLGSLNAVAQTAGGPFWRRWLGEALASADTMGRVFAQIDLGTLRTALRRCYTQLRRNKSLHPVVQGLFALIVDGHESHASFRRCCAGCLTRTVHTRQGERRQYYHRQVLAHLPHEVKKNPHI